MDSFAKTSGRENKEKWKRLVIKELLNEQKRREETKKNGGHQ